MFVNIQGNSANSIVFQIFDRLVNGERFESNSHRNIETMGKTLFVQNLFYELFNPRNRHLSLVGRNSNIFQMIAETIWVMSGDDRIDPYLSFFLPRAKDYSDDGKTWRGAYGPRLYRYNQLQDALDCFVKEGKDTRRSVVSIFLPELDSEESLKRVYGLDNTVDRPCNNMLHFYVTNNKFNCNLFQRSGDVAWGMGSINIFEFTFLQEYMFEKVRQFYPDVELGTFHHFVTNAHMYEKTAKQAFDVLSERDKQVFEFKKSKEMKFSKGNIALDRKFFSDLQKFFINLIEIDEEFDVEDSMDYIDTIFENYGITTENNLLRVYCVLIVLYILSKRFPFSQSKIYCGDMSDDLRLSIEISKFRKFDIC